MQFNRGNIWRLLTSCGRLSSLVIAILAMCALASAAARAGSSVTLAMSLTPLSAPVIIAAEKGYFAAHGIDVGIKDYVGGMRTAKAMFEGKADMATSSEVVVMFNSFKRSDFSVICTFVTSDNDVKIVTRKDTGIRNVADLAGMTVGTVTGASAQFFLDETLFLAGVDGAEVDVIQQCDEVFYGHVTLLKENGIFILETMNTGRLAKEGVHEFMFVLGQARIKGTVQMIINPVAMW